MIAIVVYNLLDIYVLSKLNVNKWVVLVIGLLVFFVPPILAAIFKLTYNPKIFIPIQSIILVVLFLWFFDLISNKRNNKKQKDIKIKPKAKPNRVKNMNKEDDSSNKDNSSK